jgi:hypothetical protein
LHHLRGGDIDENRHSRYSLAQRKGSPGGCRFCDSLDFTLELSGSCIHHIDGRSGVFSDAEGVFTLFDVITNVTGDPVTGAFTPGSAANNLLYYGRIRTSDRKGAAAVEDSDQAQSRALAAGTVAVKKSRSGRAC